MLDTKLLIIGIGNRMRCDDSAGPETIDILKEKLSIEADFLEERGEPASIMESWKGRDKVILIDCVIAGKPPGHIHYLDLSNTPLPDEMGKTSSHAFGLAEAVELSRAMKKLPKKLFFYGIEGGKIDIGKEISPAVKTAINTVTERIQKQCMNFH
ncbi:MAG: hydrogenase maturation protease [Alphaproteobacteria bacterium]|nr:hydrogenase maturation protease [Alphaproteobacteria bacterium]